MVSSIKLPETISSNRISVTMGNVVVVKESASVFTDY